MQHLMWFVSLWVVLIHQIIKISFIGVHICLVCVWRHADRHKHQNQWQVLIKHENRNTLESDWIETIPIGKWTMSARVRTRKSFGRIIHNKVIGTEHHINDSHWVSQSSGSSRLLLISLTTNSWSLLGKFESKKGGGVTDVLWWIVGSGSKHARRGAGTGRGSSSNWDKNHSLGIMSA